MCFVFASEDSFTQYGQMTIGQDHPIVNGTQERKAGDPSPAAGVDIGPQPVIYIHLLPVSALRKSSVGIRMKQIAAIP
jgi:hypothetical protein